MLIASIAYPLQTSEVKGPEQRKSSCVNLLEQYTATVWTLTLFVSRVVNKGVTRTAAQSTLSSETVLMVTLMIIWDYIIIVRILTIIQSQSFVNQSTKFLIKYTLDNMLN